MYNVSQVRKSESSSFKVLTQYEIYINLQIDYNEFESIHT